MAKGLPERPATKDSASGTLTHAIVAECANTSVSPGTFLGREMEADGFKFTVDEPRIARAQFALDIYAREPGEHFIEVALDTSPIVGVAGQKGTADFAALQPEQRMITVLDLKDGQELVRAAGNEQLLEYGAAAMHKYDLVEEWLYLRVGIIQPRHNMFDEVVYTRDEVIDFISKDRPLSQLAYALYEDPSRLELGTHLTPGDKQCRWCPVRGNCPARTRMVVDMFKSVGGSAEKPVVIPHLDDATLAALFPLIGMMEKFCHDTRIEQRKRALSGRRLPGLKLVRGKKGDRYWKEPAKVKALMDIALEPEQVEQMYEPRTLLSPTQAEKLLKKDYAALKPFVDQASGGLQLVADSDKRPAVVASTDDFKKVEVTDGED